MLQVYTVYLEKEHENICQRIYDPCYSYIYIKKTIISNKEI